MFLERDVEETNSGVYDFPPSGDFIGTTDYFPLSEDFNGTDNAF